MPGSGIGMAYANISGGRVAGNEGSTGIFIPAHIDAAGKTQSARAILSIYVNKKRRNEPERFKVTFFGKLAEVAAKFGPGKELGLQLELNSYRGKVYDPASRQPVMLNNQVLTTEQIGMVVRDLTIGEDGTKHIEWEKANGLRPMNWNTPNHPDVAAFATANATKNATQYTGGDTYGCCRVITPNGQIVQPQAAGQPTLATAVAGAVDTNLGAPVAPAAAVATTAPAV
jgi:single-stranded DNA-binding protein